MTYQLPGKTNVVFENIPAELQRLNQWVVWKWEVTANGFGKVPYYATNPVYKASTTNPNSWSGFIEARQSYYANADVAGIGFVFSENDPYFGIDFDDKSKMREGGQEERNLIQSYLRSVSPSYQERSPSGLGWHFIYSAGRPNFAETGGVRFDNSRIEVYCKERFFTFTGQVEMGLDGPLDKIVEVRDLYDALVALKPSITLDRSLGTTGVFGRRTDLTNSEVVERAMSESAEFALWIEGKQGAEPGQWSETFYHILRHLDRITGNPSQARDIVLASPFVTMAPPSRSGERRERKVNRLFEKDFAKARAENDAAGAGWFPHFREHGRQIVQAMQRAQEERERALREENERYALTLEQREKALQGLTESAANLLHAFPFLPEEYKTICRPPGIIGEFVEAAERATYYPYTKYAIPPIFAALSGLTGRQYKIDGNGLAMTFILAAPMSTGKTDHMKAVTNFMSAACGEVLGSPRRIHNTEAASIQGIFDQFMETRSGAWFSEESFGMLSAMTAGRSENGDKLRNGFNKLFDASSKHQLYHVPSSRASKNSGAEPIPNLNISCYWTMTPVEFRQFSGTSQDGFISRLIIVQELSDYGKMVDHKQTALPEHLHRRLVELVGRAQMLDNEYSQLGHQYHMITGLVDIDFSHCETLFSEIRKIVDEVRRRSLKIGDDNKTIVGRIVPNVLRLAGTMAVVENPNWPSVTPQQMLWALGYVVQNMVTYLSDVDKGIIGDKQSDTAAAVWRGFNVLIRQPEYRKLGAVPWSKLTGYCRDRLPFKGQLGAMALVSSTIKSMVENGELVEGTDDSNSRGPKRKLLMKGGD